MAKKHSLQYDSWQDFVVNSQIHLDYINQTYDVFYMVEKTANASNVLSKFYYGSKLDPLNAVKPVAYEEILTNIKNFSELPLHGDRAVKQLYNTAALESIEYLNKHKVLPCSWIAALIKLHIMYLLDKDVLKVYHNTLYAKDLQLTQTTLLEGEKKPKVKIDPCDPRSIFFKPTSVLKPTSRKNTPGQEPNNVPPKHMFFVIIGFYDYDLFTELFLCKVPVTGFVELAGPEVCGEICNRTDCNVPVETDTSAKLHVLTHFWEKFYNGFDFLQCFDNTFHMIIQPFAEAFSTDNLDDKLCFDVFINIGNEIVKILDIQRWHTNYIRNLKICEIKSQPKFIAIKHYSLYKNVFDVLPPECFSIQIIIDAMLDQISAITKSLTEDNSSVFHKTEIPDNVQKYHFGLKTCVVDVINQNITNRSVRKGSVNEDCSKTYIAITRNQFMIDANNENYVKVSPYESIRGEYLLRHQHLLEKCYSALLWRKYHLPEENKVLTNKYNLKTLADDLNISIQELQYVVHAILLIFIKCSRNLPLKRKAFFQNMFPLSQDRAPNVTSFKANIKKKTTPIEVDPLCQLNITIPNLSYSDVPNVYESKNLENYKWYEKLSADVMLQELYKAERFYLCTDYKYCVFDDTILLRFHNNLNDFGINRTTWNQSLRTHVGVKEFCKYIVHEDSRWLENEEKKYVDSFENEYQVQLQLDEEHKQKIYPKLIFSDADFIQPGSFKAKKIGARSGVIETLSKNNAKGRSKTALFSGTSALEKLSLPTEMPVRKKLSLHYAKAAPYNFFAYDISKKRMQLTGSTIVFCSQDGVKVTVDQTQFIRESNNMSLNITAAGHSLVLHKNERTWLEPFTFHFTLSDDTIMAFGKPYKPIQPEEKLIESIYYSQKEDNQNKRQNLFFISDRQNFIVKCFNIPFVTKKHLILSEKLLLPFLNHIKKKGIPLKVISSSETLNNDNEAENNLNKSTHRPKPLHKITCQAIFKARSFSGSKEQIENDAQSVDDAKEIFFSNNNRRPSSSENIAILKKSNRKITKEIEKAMESQLPIFKICSSKLHRFQYVKRVKSYVEVALGSVLKRISVNPCLQQIKRKIHISKLLPIQPLIIRNYPKYELKLCLPSGLTVESVAGFDNDPFCIRQLYTDKGPQCKNITHEVARIFMRNGTLLIKRSDGDFDIFYINGQIVNCKLPNYLEKSSDNENSLLKKVKKGYSLSNLTYLHAYGTSSTRFKKYLQRVVHRIDKHVIGKVKTKTFSNYSRCKSGKYGLSPKIIYLLQTSVAPFTKFSLITSDGKKLKVTKTAVTKEKKFFTSITNEYRYEEFLFDREDGTHMLFNRESELFIQFADGTRISSWITVEDSLVNVLEQEPTCVNNKCNASEQVMFSEQEESFDLRSKSEIFKEENGWVSIVVNFKFEHPNYGTVIFDGVTQNAEIILPGNLKIDIKREGEYHIDISKNISATVTASNLIFETHLCNTCLQKCVAILNIKPLYDKVRSMVNSSEVELLQITDSFNKKFVVNFDGQCYNNTDFIRGRYNSVNCPIHNQFEYQKLYLLKRDLNGCKFWDVNAYRNKIQCAIEETETSIKFHDNKTFQTFFSTSFITKMYEPIDERYLLPYDEPRLLMTKLKTNPAKALKCLYVKKQILKDLPELAKVVIIYKTLIKYAREKNINEIVSNKELNDFFSNILRQSVEEDEKSKMQQEKLEIQLAVAAEMVPPLPLAERWRKWKHEVNLYLSKIRRKYVPLYNNSKLRRTLLKDSEAVEVPIVEVKLDDSTSLEVDVPYDVDDVENNLRDKTESDIAENTREKLPVIVEDNEDVKVTVKTEAEIIKVIEKVEVMSKTKKEELLEIPLAMDIFRELVLRYSLFVANIIVDDNDTSSYDKVQYVAEKIYINIIRVAKELRQVPQEDLIKVACKILVNNIRTENLNPLEMYLLLDNFTGNEKDDICKMMYDSALADCLQNCKMSKEMKIRRKTIFTDPTDSAFQLYSGYAVKQDIVEYFDSDNDEATPTSRNRSLTIVYEAKNESGESMEKTLLEKNKFLLTTSYTNLLADKGSDFCDKCVNKNDLLKEREMSKDDVQSSSLSSCNMEVNWSSVSNTLAPRISPDSNIPVPATDDVTTIDSHTHLLQKYNFIPPESSGVLFSMAPMKGNNIDNVGPFVERHPKLVEQNLLKIIESTSEKENDQDETSLGTCSRCLLKGHQSIQVDQANPQSLTQMLQTIKSGNMLPCVTGETENSLANILEAINEVSNKGKAYKTRVMAKVGDQDKEYLKSDCPPTHDPALCVKEQTEGTKRKIIRKNVGMVTQSGTVDRITQT